MKKHRKLIIAIVVAGVLIAALTTVGVMAFGGEQTTRQPGASEWAGAALNASEKALRGDRNAYSSVLRPRTSLVLGVD